MVFNWNKLGLFAGGVLFGTAGIAVLKSKDAKAAYTQCTAAVLRGKDSVMKTCATLKENCGDIASDAVDINDRRYAADEEMQLEKAKAFIAAYEEKKAAEEKDAE